MLKMRERSASRSVSRRSVGGLRFLVRLLLFLPLPFALLAAAASPARAATRRIALVRADRDLARSVDLALYPWDITVVDVDEPPPDTTGPSPRASARLLAKRHGADAVAWIERGADVTTLWFFDPADDSLHSRRLPVAPGSSPDDPAELAAIALTLKTFVRAAPWESRIPTVRRERRGAAWESRVDLDLLGRAPTSGTSGEPRLGVWASVWYGTQRLMWGAALGTSAGLGMTFENANATGTLQDIDARGGLRARVGLGARFFLEPKVGASAHVERAQITTTTALSSGQSYTRVDPSLDLGLSLGWRVTDAFSWSIGIEALESLRYQRWLEGATVVFDPSPLWIQAGSSIAWSFR